MTIERHDLKLSGVSITSLAGRLGTPLYVYDDATLRSAAAGTAAAFRELRPRISFAAKACDAVGILRVFAEEGLDLDVVSAGEIHAGLNAGFSPGRMHLHGNCKSDAELYEAVRLEVQAVVIDNIEEVGRLQRVAANLGRQVRVSIRTTLPLEAETHPHLQTSGYYSKFGILRGSEDERACLGAIKTSRNLLLEGVHVHLGSQISDAGIYARAAEALIEFGRSLRVDGFPLREISLGGGWAVGYRSLDSSLAATEVAVALRPFFQGSEFLLTVEPGRSLVARSAVAVYQIGSVKHVPGRRIVAVDGGMGDNPRPALYGAPYDAFLVTNPTAPFEGPADIVGRYCESGDVLARNVALPPARAGDLLCIPMSGAYQVAMGSTYNLVPLPAVTLVAGGAARLIIRRGSIEDVLRRTTDEPVA